MFSQSLNYVQNCVFDQLLFYNKAPMQIENHQG